MLSTTSGTHRAAEQVVRRALTLLVCGAGALGCAADAVLDRADSGAPDATAAAADAALDDASSSPPAPDASPAGPDAPDAETAADAAPATPDATPATPDAGTVSSTTPPPLPRYSDGTCPRLVGGRTSSTSVVANFTSQGNSRSFRLLVPRTYDGTRPFPLMFAWHWLNASSGSFVRDGELETAVEQMGFIAVLPDKKLKPNGDKQYVFDWPFADPQGAAIDEELVFFDDLLACVTEQFAIDRTRIYGIGVSAGALWVTMVSTTSRGNYFAAIESLSGGLGEVAGAWQMTYTPQPHKFPALVLWGGANDWLGINFDRASQRYRDALTGDGHFVVTCTHDAGHAMPPIEAPPGGGTRFYMLWQFMLDHTYGTTAGASPYQATGLPAAFPSWCAIATP